MKKETIFRYEINESMAADAAMSCLKNRNNPKQLNETSDFDNRFALRKDLKGMANDVTKKAYMLIRKEFGDSMWRQLGMDDCDEQGLISQINDYQTHYGITDPQAIVNKMLGRKATEQEETVDIPQLAEDVVASYRGRLSKMDEKERVNFISTMVMKKMGKSIDTLTPQEKKEILAAAKHSMWYVSEQEEDYGMNDLRKWRKSLSFNGAGEVDDTNYDDDSVGIDMIADLLVANGEISQEEKESVKPRIKELLDEHGLWIGEDEHEAERFISLYWDNQEQEELPQMERRDMILALSEYMSESWIATDDEDGDLDDIYYAIADILDKTGDYPASTSWEDCKPWCQKHYKEVEAKIYPCTTKVTVRTPMGMKQMNLSTEVIEAFVKQTGSHDFSDRSAVRVIAGIVKELTKKGYTPTEDEQKIVDIQNKKIKQGMASRNAATDRSMNALSD